MNNIEEYETSVENAKELVKLRDSLKRLEGNRDFKKIFGQGYFDIEVKRLTGLLASSAMQHKREALVESLAAIAHTQEFMRGIWTEGNAAEAALIEYEAARDEMLLEDEGY